MIQPSYWPQNMHFFDVIRAVKRNCDVDVKHTLSESLNNSDGGKSWELPPQFLEREYP